MEGIISTEILYYNSKRLISCSQTESDHFPGAQKEVKRADNSAYPIKKLGFWDSKRVMRRNYDGVGPSVPTKEIGTKRYLDRISAIMGGQPEMVLASWPEVIGPSFAHMTKAVSFVDEILVVRVSNSTLYSMLVQHNYGRLLSAVREKNPSTNIRKIKFVRG